MGGKKPFISPSSKSHVFCVDAFVHKGKILPTGIMSPAYGLAFGIYNDSFIGSMQSVISAQTIGNSGLHPSLSPEGTSTDTMRGFFLHLSLRAILTSRNIWIKSEALPLAGPSIPVPNKASSIISSVESRSPMLFKSIVS